MKKRNNKKQIRLLIATIDNRDAEPLKKEWGDWVLLAKGLSELEDKYGYINTKTIGVFKIYLTDKGQEFLLKIGWKKAKDIMTKEDWDFNEMLYLEAQSKL